MKSNDARSRAGGSLADLRRVTLPIVLTLSSSVHAAQLPVVCVAGSCGASVSGWVSSGQATGVAAGNTLTIQQTSEQAILNWSSFNVSADGRVIFKQPDSSAIALNQIFQASPSQIFGLVQANGQIYLVNQNGFVFGPTAQVNVGGLLASTLQLTAPLSSGLLSPVQQFAPALASDGRTVVLDGSGNPVMGPDGQPIPVQIVVQPGAQISTSAAGQRILLAGQSVSNGGSINAPDGQVILAAGQSVFLEASTDPSLRGLLVEVNSGGLAANQLQGSISVNEGNVTLVGLAVNQQGRISATTSVSENGSIRLLARDTTAAEQIGGQLVLQPSRGGTLTLGAQSQTEVLPDTLSTATAIDEQAQPVSTITLAGQQVELAGGSHVAAPGGQVAITASSDPSLANSSSTPDPNAHLRIDSGAVIDVSGDSAVVPVTRNLVSVQLRGTELADSPLQRDGPLRGQTVIVDARVGTPLANVSGELALIQRGVLERTSEGGTITLDSGGDVVVGAGATLNVSGGQVAYTPGIIQTSLLVKPDGSTVDIGAASPNQVYTGVVNPTFESISNEFGVIQFIPTPGIARYDPGYTQGMSAGTIQVLGSSLVLQGTFLGQAVNGIYQRSGSGVAAGGTFIVGAPSSTPSLVSDLRAPAVELVNEAAPVVVDSNASLPSDYPLQLSTSLIGSGGFTHVEISSNDRITIAPGVSLDFAPGGSLSLEAPQININSSISIPAGSIQATSLISANAPIGTPGLGVFVGNGVTLDVSGSWINDSLVPLNQTPSGPALIAGGSVQLDQDAFQGTLSLGDNVRLLANGGAQLQRGGALSSGSGGSIGLIGSPSGTVQVGNGDVVQGFGVQGAVGGSFSLEVPRLLISSGDSTWLRAQSVDSDPNSNGVFRIDSSVFSNFGFSSFTLTADGPSMVSGPSQDTLTVAANTSIDLRTRTLQLDSAASSEASGSPLFAFAAPTLLPLYQRSASQLTLQATPGDIASTEIGNLSVGTGAVISADPGSALTLATVGSLLFNGSMNIPAGNVSLEILNPAPGFDPGYVPTQRIELGPSSAVNVSGTVVYTPESSGLLFGNVLSGGNVSLAADRGSVVTDAGSTINFSGSQAPIDIASGSQSNVYQRETVASAAGSLSVSAPVSISLLGAFEGRAGVGTTGTAPGGSLNLTLSRANVGADATPDEPAVITVQSAALTSVLLPDSGSAVLSTVQLAQSGVDALSLTADDGVQFANNTQLNLARSVVITAPAVSVAAGGNATITAPYLALGSGSSGELPQPALPGTGSLAFSGAEVNLVGSLAIQGAATTTITSSGEILLRGELVDTSNLGSLSVAGSLTLASARVVPTTEVNFTITASGGQDNTVEFQQTGSLSGVPLSVNGSLTVEADNIIQSGTVFAPFGQLTFDANQTLTFSPGSLTSVSGSGAVLPFGTVQNGSSWIYQVNPNPLLLPASVTVLPSRQVTASGARVVLQSGATIDVSGGGDVDAYGFTPGTGGTTDVLSPGVTPGLYAVLPSLAGQTAPYDPMMWAGSNIAPNESVYLSGGGGLAAGTYPILPARYALLPGAFLISVVQGYQDLQSGVVAQAGNGFPIVSGYLTYGGTGVGATRSSGFLVEPGAYAQVLADYTNNYASTFFASTTAAAAASGLPSSPLPADAGTLLVSVQSQFLPLGSVKGTAAQGGEGATIEISAPAIEIDPSVSTSSVQPGQTLLATNVIDGWNAGRLWIGAQANQDGSVSVGANTVTVTSGSAITADEIILAANQSVQIDANAIVTTSSASTPSLVPPAASAAPVSLALAPDSAGAAVLAVSDLNYWVPDRGGTGSGSTATVNIASAATVSSRGAITIDAPAGGLLGDGALAGSGARWSIAADNLTFGPQSAGNTGFAVDTALVGVLQSAGAVRFASASVIDVDQAVSIGPGSDGPTLAEIDFVTPGLTNQAGAAAARFAATLITLGGGSAAPSTPQAGSGTVSLTAGEIDIGSGNIGFSGFSTTTLDAANVIVGEGVATMATAGSLSLLAPVVTTTGGSQIAISAGSNLTLAASVQSRAGSAPVLESGGTLALAAAGSITDSTLIAMPSGEVSLNASQQLLIASGGGIDVAGVLPANAAHGSDGGTIALTAAGNLTVARGSSMTVAAGSGANAGSISVLTSGVADIEGELAGSSVSGLRSGSFTLQAASIPNFATLNASLENSGFHDLRSIEVRAGDLDLAAGSVITAQTVMLTADSGAINVAGTIDVSGASGGGSMNLNGSNAVTLGASGSLRANGVNSGAAGGLIELASSGGSVRLDPASEISATGTGTTGSLLIRAPVAASGSDVNIAELPANLSSVGSVVLEPIIAESIGALPSAAQFAAIESGVAGFMAAATPNILSRLGVQTTSNVVLRPYADITTTGSITLPSINLSSWRFDGQPVDLSIRAAGSITVAGTLSDGFATTGGVLDTLAGPSARISLVAGADLASASATAVRAGVAANLELNAGAIVRTGTGGLNLTASQDVGFASNASVYTGGVAGAPTIERTSTGVPLSFPTLGGNIVVTAGRDVLGAPVDEAVDEWNPRIQPAGSGGPAVWGIDFQNFQWNVGALGGGTVVINAGRNATNLTAAVADSRTFSPDGSTSISLGGGNLRVSAGGDIDSGLFYVGDGVGQLDAGGALGSSRSDALGHPLGTLLLAGDATFDLSAQGNILLNGILPVTALAPSRTSNRIYFLRYDAGSSLELESRGGSVTYDNNPLENESVIGTAGATQSNSNTFNSAPPSLDIAAFGGDIIINSTLFLAPSAQGQLSLYASRDITSSSAVVGMSDQTVGALPTPDAPASNSAIYPVSNLTYTGASLHQNDPNPVLIAAGRDVTGIEFDLPKQADISAGRNIVSMTLQGQNLNPNDVTLVQAGGDIEYTNADSSSHMTITGPGQLELVAGGNIDLGFSQGITTYGNILNANLKSATGASITILAGLEAPIGVSNSASSNDFVGTVIGASTNYENMLVNYVEQLTGQSNLSYTTSAQQFRSFALAEQLPLINGVYFDELVASGEEANSVPSLGFTRGYTAIDTLFPASRSSTSPFSGNLSLAYSRIYTLDGGSISILLPGGSLDVGLANPPATFAIYGIVRDPSDLGIVAAQSGDVDIYSFGNVLVNQSRVFTLGGGDLTIWSTAGNIDAGNGAKTSISAPPPTVQVDANGNVTLDFSAAIAGSGIRTIQSEPDVAAGNVNLIAPVGFVNAGDAGIGSAGNINIAAQRVIGATNINFGGTATGVPPEVSGIGASLSGASAVANSSTTASSNAVDNAAATASAAPAASAALGWLDVFLEGFGEEVCKSSDLECLKRNQKNP